MNNDYYKTKESVEEYIHLAKDVNGQPLITRLSDFLPQNSLLLEIGSGPGTDYQILQKNYTVVGSDYSDEFLNRLRAIHQNNEFLLLDATTLNTDKKFDGIYSNKVLQHLTDEQLRKSIQRQVNILHQDGIICHSFWKGEGDEIFKGLLVNYQNNDSIRKLFEDDFDTLLLEEYKEFEDGDSIVFIGKKK